MCHFTFVHSTEFFSLRVLIFVITFTAYILILDIAKSAREKESLQGAKTALTLQLDSANQQLAAMQASHEQAATYRYDMRHHFSMISSFIVDGNTEQVKDYVRNVQADFDQITPSHYCKNNTVNFILSSFVSKGKNQNVHLSVDVDLPESLPVSETELCTLLANGLENAISAQQRLKLNH